MATRKKRILDVDLNKEFFTEEEIESMSDSKEIVKLGCFWSGGKQLFRVSLSDKPTGDSE